MSLEKASVAICTFWVRLSIFTTSCHGMIRCAPALMVRSSTRPKVVRMPV